ncbi:VCBS repeat-containing protein [Paraglaciecola sp. 25GB23A]|uniref:FG-GAP repeat domain-containing protein n=1 Tax=Paraglaciecola sp. 25GB23A TaxID=3156068 RepID=UPI0032AE9EAD
MRMLTLAVFTLCASVANAAKFTVSTVSELEDALTVSRTNGEADKIVISEGVYFFSNYLNLGNSDNELTIEGDSNLNPEKIVFDGTSSSKINAAIFLANNPIHKISIRNLTIQNGERPIFIGGNNTYPVEISNVNFLNNTESAVYHSGSSRSAIKKLIIKNSIFKNNSGNSYGGAIASMNLLVESSRFENNTAPDGGGAIICGNSFSYPDNCIVYNSEFIGNSCSPDSAYGSNDISGAGHILNSIFDGLGSSSPSQPSVKFSSSGSFLVANNLFINNEVDLKFLNSKIFLINNVLNNIDAGFYGANLYHNIFTQVYPSMNSGAWVDVNNTYNSTISFDANYKTTAYDLVVGKGYDPLVLDEFKDNQLLIDAMQTDYEDNPRILGIIDIGPYEFSTTKSRIPINDVDGDGKSDLLWRSSTRGWNFLWAMNGTQTKLARPINVVQDDGWLMAGQGDYDGDGKSDILWRNTITGLNFMYLMDGLTIKTRRVLNYVDAPQWKLAGSGDFNGDGTGDVLWHDVERGRTQLYLMDGLAISTNRALAVVTDLNEKIVAVGDVNGDGTDDVIWRNQVTGMNYIWIMKDGQIDNRYTLNSINADWTIAGAGDLNGDGTDDIILRNQVDGLNWAFMMENGQIKTSQLINTVGSLDWQIANMGDYDGDGKTDFLWRNEAAARNIIHLMDGLTIKDKGVLRPTDNTWTLSK